MAMAMAIRSRTWFVGLVAFVFVTSFLLADARPVAVGGSSKRASDFDMPASFAITNDMDINAILTANCHSDEMVLSPTLIETGSTFTYDLGDGHSWICDFAATGGSASGSLASVPVWAHDGTPYLSVCEQCLWKVKDDGFYILNTGDNAFRKVRSWSRSSLWLVPSGPNPATSDSPPPPSPLTRSSLWLVPSGPNPATSDSPPPPSPLTRSSLRLVPSGPNPATSSPPDPLAPPAPVASSPPPPCRIFQRDESLTGPAHSGTGEITETITSANGMIKKRIITHSLRQVPSGPDTQPPPCG